MREQTKRGYIGERQRTFSSRYKPYTRYYEPLARNVPQFWKIVSPHSKSIVWHKGALRYIAFRVSPTPKSTNLGKMAADAAEADLIIN